MKLFTKQIDDKLFAQYPLGNDLESQVVVAKIFNPYGKGTWYLLNSDPEDPDYIWAIVDFQELEIGSVSRASLENTIIGPFKLNLERDLSFEPINAAELFNKLRQGHRHFKNGGGIYDKGGRISKGEKVVPNPEFFKGHTGKYKHIFGIVTEMPYENEQGVVVVKFETIQGEFEEHTFMEESLKRYVTNDHKQFAGGGSVSDARYIRPEEIIAVYLKNGKVFRNGYSSDHVPMFSGLLVSNKPVTKDENTDQMALFKPGGKLDKKHLPKTAKYIKRSDIEKVEVGVYEDEPDETIKGSHLFSGIWFDDEQNVRRYERAKAEGRFGKVKKAKAPKKAKGEVFAGGGGVGSNEEIEYTVRYEKEVDGEYDNFTKEFTDVKQAMRFATDNYSSIEYIKSVNGKEVEFGFVNAETGALMPYKKSKYADGGGVGSEQVWKHKHMNMTAVILGPTAKGYKVQTTDYTFKKPKVKIEYFHKQDFDDPGRALFEKQFAGGGGVRNWIKSKFKRKHKEVSPKEYKLVVTRIDGTTDTLIFPNSTSAEKGKKDMESLGHKAKVTAIYAKGGGVDEFPFEHKGYKYNVENTGGVVNDRGQALFKVSIQEHGEYTERAANLDLAKQYARAEINKIIEENAFAKGGNAGWKHKRKA